MYCIQPASEEILCLMRQHTCGHEGKILQTNPQLIIGIISDLKDDYYTWQVLCQDPVPVPVKSKKGKGEFGLWAVTKMLFTDSRSQIIYYLAVKESAHDVLLWAGSEVCPVGVLVAAVAPGVASPVEGEAAGVRRPGLLPPQQPALGAQGAASA